MKINWMMRGNKVMDDSAVDFEIRMTVKEALEKAKMSQYSLANKLGKRPNYATVICKERQNPKLETLVKISNAIGCPITDLFEVLKKDESASAQS